VVRIAELGTEAAADDCFGGKAAGLARLARAGARVPEGFAIEATRVEPRRWPEATRNAFRERVAALIEVGPVAVRSSAAGEDGNTRSFAGIFETVLGVGSVSDALEAATHCIASGDATRLYAYAGPSDPVPVGLVVQRQVGARSAGVCFTRDPLGRDGALLEAVSGSGHALVSGHVQPEAWRVYPSGLGGLAARRNAGDSGPPVLAAAEAIEIAREARALAESLGEPLDLEWVRDADGRLWWLQARPVTACLDLCNVTVERTAPDAHDGSVTVWSNFNLRETMPDPLPPLVWSLWRDRLMSVLLRSFVPPSVPESTRRELMCVDRLGGRIYWNLNAALAVPVFGPMLSSLSQQLDPSTSERLAELRRARVLQRRRVRGSMRLLGASVAAQLRGMLGLRFRPEEALGELRGLAVQWRRDADQARSELTSGELVEEVRRITDPEALALHRFMGPALLGSLVFQLAQLAFRRHPEAARRLAVGIRGNPTTEMSLAVDQLIECARPVADAFEQTRAPEALLSDLSERSEGQHFLARFGAFLAENGQRGPKEFDLSVPRWNEAPDLLLGLVRAGLREPSKESLVDRFARLARERRDAIQNALAASPAWKRPLLSWLERAVERSMPLREAPKHHGLVVFEHVRRIVLELGSRLAAQGRLATRDDIFFLDWRELEAWFAGGLEPDWRRLVLERREELARLCTETPDEIVRSDGVPVREPAGADEAGVLRGTGIATGRVQGRVRVLHHPDPGALEPGDVLVVRCADPGWTPLFPRAAALVMEVGGVLCHAAVVARELGLPAVFGVHDATRRLENGARVEVDAIEGTVRRL
jgi:pyruvate,water dikinase